jgi:hypothetical protein
MSGGLHPATIMGMGEGRDREDMAEDVVGILVVANSCAS